MPAQGSDLYLNANEQDLLVAALNSNQNGSNGTNKGRRASPQETNFSSNPASGQLDYSDDSPYLDFIPDDNFDDSYSYGQGRMIGDLPDLHEKRKSMDGEEDEEDEDEQGDRKRHEGDEKGPKKPGRKPLTSEPTTKRKAQNRAAQRAFRDRKEKHLKDLETKVDGLEKASEAANHENGLLKAQVERLQVELKEYRKRLSWISNQSNGKSPTQASTQKTVNSSNDFQFEFPKFGDLPAMSSTNMFNNSSATTQNRSSSMTSAQARSNGIPKTANPPRANSTGQQQQRQGSATQSPVGNTFTGSPQSMSQQQSKGSVDSLSGLFSPSILEATRQASMGGYFPQTNSFAANSRNSQTAFPNNAVYSNSTTSNSDSPGSSTESQNAISSIGTSPEPSLSSPGNKMQDFNLNTIDENQMSNTFGFNNTFGNASLNNTYDLNASWLPADAGTNFDPVLFGDYRETQDNILSQDFGSFFNDAYPLPDLGSPLHNYNDVIAPEQTSSGIMAMPQKIDLIRQVDAAKDGSEEVVPNTDKPLSCNKIWDRLQSMEKFRNGEIDIDNLCSELRAKAKCSEGGAVVDKRDVDKILGK